MKGLSKHGIVIGVLLIGFIAASISIFFIGGYGMNPVVVNQTTESTSSVSETVSLQTSTLSSETVAATSSVVRHTWQNGACSGCPSIAVYGLRWHHKTLRILVTSDSGLSSSEGFTGIVSAAAEMWRLAMDRFGLAYDMPNMVGFQFQVTTDQTQRWDVHIHFTSGYVCDASADALCTIASGVTQAQVRLSVGIISVTTKIRASTTFSLIPTVIEKVVGHEFGHALGLGEALSFPTLEMMAPYVITDMRITTLDLYGLGLLYSDMLPAPFSVMDIYTVWMPSTIPYENYTTS